MWISALVVLRQTGSYTVPLLSGEGMITLFPNLIVSIKSTYGSLFLSKVSYIQKPPKVSLQAEIGSLR